MNKPCNSCKKDSKLVLRGVSFCNECFQERVCKRINAELNKRSQAIGGDKLLFVFTGSQENVAILDVLKQYKLKSRGKRSFSLQLLHINTYSLLAQTNNLNDEEEYFENLQTISKQFGFQFESVGLEINEKEKTFLDLLKSCSRYPSIQDELILIATRRKIYNYAHQNDFDVIIFSDTAEQLGFRTICLLGQGRGSSLASHVNICRNKKQTAISICYPAKHTQMGELVSYLKTKDLVSIKTPTVLDLTKKKKNYKSITQNFYNQLTNSKNSSALSIIKITDAIQWNEIDLKLLNKEVSKNENEKIEKQIENNESKETETEKEKVEEKEKENENENENENEKETEKENEKEKEKEKETDTETENEKEKEKETENEKENENEKEKEKEKEKENVNQEENNSNQNTEICHICWDSIPEELQEESLNEVKQEFEIEVTICEFCRSRIIPFVDFQLLKKALL